MHKYSAVQAFWTADFFIEISKKYDKIIIERGAAMELKFRPDGTFRIMQIADIQDTQITSKDTVELIEAALDKDKPDLVVFTGDQIKGYGFTLSLGNREENVKKAFDNFLKPVVDRNIPFTFCFGNHDVVYIGAAAGDQACIANVIRTSCRYNHLNTIEDGYGISLRPLVTFALKHYQNDPCIEFIPSDEEANDVEDYDTSVIAKMHKAITIILFKLEAKIIDKHLEYKGEYLKKLDKVDFEKGEYVVNGHRYKLIDNSFPTVDPNDVYKLTKEEQELMDKLTLSFRHCDRLQRHIDFLFSHGSMYLDYNYNLLFHGCIPTLDDGSFQTFITKDNKIIKGKEYLDYLDKEMRKAYYSKKIDKDTSIFYFLWCFSSSPLYGKNDITTFERYFLNKEDRKAFKEEKNAYYKYVEDEEYCKKVLHEFNIDKERSIIINGHMPVNVKNGESPIKANGKYIVIDGGLSKAYHNVTGIAGYTLVFNSYGFKLIAHDVFKSKEDAIKNNTDIAHEKQRIVAFSDKRIPVEQTYIGNTIKERIEDLTTLLHLYQEGIIKSK